MFYPFLNLTPEKLFALVSLKKTPKTQQKKTPLKEKTKQNPKLHIHTKRNKKPNKI